MGSGLDERLPQRAAQHRKGHRLSCDQLLDRVHADGGGSEDLLYYRAASASALASR